MARSRPKEVEAEAEGHVALVESALADLLANIKSEPVPRSLLGLARTLNDALIEAEAKKFQN